MQSTLEKELENLIRIGKRTGDMKLRNHAREALFALMSDDGTPGLGNFLWKEYIRPNLKKARAKALYYKRTNNVVCFSNIMSENHCYRGGYEKWKKRIRKKRF